MAERKTHNPGRRKTGLVDGPPAVSSVQPGIRRPCSFVDCPTAAKPENEFLGELPMLVSLDVTDRREWYADFLKD